MLMSPTKLIGLRLFNLTLGRWRWFSRQLRRTLVHLLIKGREEKYTQSAQYFSWDEIGGEKAVEENRAPGD